MIIMNILKETHVMPLTSSFYALNLLLSSLVILFPVVMNFNFVGNTHARNILKAV